MTKTIKRRPFGNTGLEVTELSLGAMNLRLLPTKQEGRDIIRKALDIGINLIDTARGYNKTAPDGTLIESEAITGEVIKARGKRSEPIIVVTKGHGYNPDAFDQELETSMQKLGITGRHDLKIGEASIKFVYFFHGLNTERWQEIKQTNAIAHAMKAQKQGFFHYLGFSSHNGHEAIVKEAIETGVFRVAELPYSVFAPGFGKDSSKYGNILKKAYDAGMAVINMKAFGGNGMISKSKIFEPFCDISTQKRFVYCLSNPYICTVDAGVRSIAELMEDYKTLVLPRYDRKTCDDMEKMAQDVTAVLDHTCRECMHCLEKFSCPHGVDFPDLLAIHTKWKLASKFNRQLDAVISEYRTRKEEFEACTQCVQCNPWCEYQLDIPALLSEMVEVYG